MLINPSSIESNLTVTDDWTRIYLQYVFSIEIDFTLNTTYTGDLGGTILCSNDFSINIYEGNDSKTRISFDNTSTTFPLVLSEFTLKNGVTYKIIFIYQSTDYHFTSRDLDNNCGSIWHQLFTDTPNEMRAYIMVNDHYYSLGTYITDYASYINNIYLGSIEGTLGATSRINYKSIKTYSYPLDKNYSDIFSKSRPPLFIPITHYKYSNPTLYNTYIAEDFDTTTPLSTTVYTGYGIYTTDDTGLTNIELTGFVDQTEFNTIADNGTLVFATHELSCDSTTFTWTYTFNNVEQASHQNYLILAIDGTLIGTETLTNSLNFDIIDTLKVSYVTYRDPTTLESIPIKLLVTRYPVNALSGTYEFDYTCTFNR
jgi:hypothetical protein